MGGVVRLRMLLFAPGPVCGQLAGRWALTVLPETPALFQSPMQKGLFTSRLLSVRIERLNFCKTSLGSMVKTFARILVRCLGPRIYRTGATTWFDKDFASSS